MEGESFKGRNMGEEMKAKAKLSPGETTVARETDGLTGDEAEDALNAKMKLPLRKRYVKVEEIPSTMSVEDAVIANEEERAKETEGSIGGGSSPWLSMMERGTKRADFKDSDVEDSEEPSRAIKVNGMDISSAVSGSSVHRKIHRTDINNGVRSDSMGKDSIQSKHKKVAMRKEKLSSKKK